MRSRPLRCLTIMANVLRENFCQPSNRAGAPPTGEGPFCFDLVRKAESEERARKGEIKQESAFMIS